MNSFATLMLAAAAGVVCSGCINPETAVQIPTIQHEPVPIDPIPEVPAAAEASAPPAFDPFSVEVALDQEPTDDEPVSIAAVLVREQATVGDTVMFVVRMKVDPAWHSYAVSGPTGVSMPTKLELKLPAGVTTKSDWQYPEATTIDSIEGEIAAYVGDLRFAIPLLISGQATRGTAEIQCEIRYQACKHESCLPPDKKSLTVSLEIM